MLQRKNLSKIWWKFRNNGDGFAFLFGWYENVSNLSTFLWLVWKNFKIFMSLEQNVKCVRVLLKMCEPWGWLDSCLKAK